MIEAVSRVFDMSLFRGVSNCSKSQSFLLAPQYFGIFQFLKFITSWDSQNFLAIWSIHDMIRLIFTLHYSNHCNLIQGLIDYCINEFKFAKGLTTSQKSQEKIGFLCT